MRSDQSSANMTPERRWWKHIDCATAPTPGPFGRPPRVCIGCGRGDGEWQPADAAPPPVPAEAIEAARAAIRARWPVQIAPNTAAALARHALVAAGPALVAAGRKQAAADFAYKIRAELVCCDVYERVAPKRVEVEAQQPGWAEALSELDDEIGQHAICYWGEVSARIAEDGEPHG